MRAFATWTWATVAAVLFFGPVTAWCAVPEFVPGRILVKFKPGVATTGRAALRARLGGTRLQDFGIIRAELVAVPHLDVAKAIALARRDPSVEYAEPDYILTADAVPNDPRFGELWAMQNTGQTGGTPGADIRATSAWDLFTGAPGVRVGVIDTGIDYMHPDLAANVWVNPGEIPGNEVDDDGNGYVDDVHGYDFYNGDGDPMDDNGHGTHCAGTIAAVGNNGLGVVGVTWNCTLVAIKTLGAGGSGPTSNAVAALQYAIANDIALTSDSWGGGAYSQSLLDAIETAGAAGQIFVAAAGNTGSDTDASPHYPSSYPSAHILAVLSTNHNDVKANSSNYGATTVDLGAPGVSILSCQPGGGYQLLSGTSMAAPHVSGACALLWGRFPSMTNLQVKERILGTVDVLASLDGKCVTGGRLNVLRALSDPDATAPAAIADLTASDPGSTTLVLRWTATGDDGNAGSAWRTELRFATAPIDSASWAGAALSPTPPPEAAGTPQSVEVSGLAPLETYSFAIRAFDEFGNSSPISTAASGTTLGAASIATSSLAPVQLLTGQQATQTLVVSNLGQGRLDFSIPPPLLLLKSDAAAEGARFPVLELGKHAADPRKGAPVLCGAGGPDAGGYRWTDSDAPGGPLFDWIDITSAGTPVGFTSDDQNLGPFPIGFEFPFYGTRFDAVRLCTNGWLSFTSTTTRFTNQPLPTGGTSNPENLVAPFWDDLNFSTQGQAYWYGNGTRFVVSWVGVPHAGTLPAGGPYTFQVILEPSGEIRYQYLAMGLPLDSSTIGIQNTDRSVGVQVAFNADYVHDNLAIKIRSLPQWLTVSPASGHVLAGTSANVTVRFDASSLQGGDYDAVLRIVSNTTTSPTDLAATMQVTPAPQIVSSPAALDFGLAYLGYPGTRTLLVTNAGTAALDVTGITSSEPLLTASPASFSLAPAASQNVTLTWAPAAPTTLAGTVTIASNDPDEPTTVRSVSGSANYPPDIAASTSTLAARLVPNAVETQIVRIRNGAAPSAAALEFTVSPLVYKAGAKALPGSPAPAGYGGPDAFGYRWSDSDQPGGAPFDWVEIRSTGTPIGLTLDDQTLAGIPIGFAFPFYGGTFTTVNVCSNGWMSFTSTSSTNDNQSLPTSAAYPENLLAPFWDDLTFNPLAGAAQAFFFNDGSRFIVEYVNVPHYGASPRGPYTFEVILYPSGKIVFQYLSMSPPLDSATIGIQNSTRTTALQVVANVAYVHDGLAVSIQKTPGWLRVTPSAATLPGRAAADLTVTFDGTGLEPGVYLGDIHLVTNDPATPVVDIPVSMQVVSPTGTESQTAPARFDLALAGGNPVRGAVQLVAALPERSELDLRVYDVRGNLVRHLTRTTLEAGIHRIGWNGCNDQGETVAAGVYFVRMRAGTYSRALQVTRLR